MSASRWWRGGDRVECDEDRSRKAWIDRGVRGGQGRHSRLLRRGTRLAGRDSRFDGVGQAAVVGGCWRGATIRGTGAGSGGTGRRTASKVVGQVSGSTVLARESRDHARVAQRSRSSHGDVARWLEASSARGGRGSRGRFCEGAAPGWPSGSQVSMTSARRRQSEGVGAGPRYGVKGTGPRGLEGGRGPKS
jgi:hypothetical protein